MISVAKKSIHRRIIIALALVWVVAYVLPLPIRPLMRPDEFRYGEIAREMLASGNWVSPRFAGFRYYEKPSPGYQIHALSMKIFGENAFALRLPSALACLISGAVIYFLLARKSRDPWLPGLAVLIYWLFGIVFGIGNFVVLDSLLSMALTLAVAMLYCAYDSPTRSRCAGFLVLAGVGVGAAFLFKGFLGFVIPAAVLLPFLLMKKEFCKIFTMPWLVLLVAVAVAAPWAWKIWRAEPDFWNYFVIEEHWKRFTASTYDRDPQPFWYFLPVLLAGVLPSGILICGAWKSWGRKFFRDPLMLYALCWFIFPFLFFSASSCKLGTYILPCFPPLAILISSGLRRSMLTSPQFCRRVLGAVLGYLGLIFAAAALLFVIAISVWRFLPKLPEIYEACNFAPYAFGVLSIVVGILLWRLRHGKPRRLLAVFLLGLAPLFPCAMGSIPKGVLAPGKTPERGIAYCLSQIELRPDDVIAAENSGMGAVAWCLKRNDIMLINGMGEFRYALENYPDEYGKRFFKAKKMKKLLASIRPRRLVLIVLEDLDKDTLPKKVPKPKQVVSGYGVTVAVY